MITLTHRSLEVVENAQRELNLEILEFEYGCLLDNFFYSTGDHCILAIETALNCWSSDYTVYIGTYDECIEKWESLGFVA